MNDLSSFTKSFLKKATKRATPRLLNFYQGLQQIRQRLSHLELIVNPGLDERLRDLGKRLDAIHSKIELIESRHDWRVGLHMSQRPYLNPEIISPQGSGFNYTELESTFRGPRDKVKQILLPYAKYFNDGIVLDLGCGNGEFLEILRDNGIRCLGIDQELNAIEECKKKRLEAERADLLEYLNTQKQITLNGIFSAQVIEHMHFSQVIKLVRECRRVLTPNSPMILETINPCSPSAMKYFYLDPTHEKPIHPETLSYVCHAEGFSRVEVLYQGMPDWGKDPYFDAPVYAVIARKLD